MFDIGWTEMLVVAVVAILVIGPKDLPAALRGVGRWTGKMKRMARDFQGQFNEALREAELDQVRKDIVEIGRMDPMADLKKDLNKASTDIKSSLDKVAAPDPELKKIAAEKGPDEPPPVAEPAKAEALPALVAGAPVPIVGAPPVAPVAEPVTAPAEVKA